MKASNFYKLVITTVKNMKSQGYSETNFEQWLTDFKGNLYDELADNLEEYEDISEN